MGQQYERPNQPADQRAQVVGGGEIGQRPAGIGGWVFGGGSPLLQQCHQQRHLGADQAADQRGAHRQHDQGSADEREHHVQRGRRQPADDAQQCFDGDESDCRPGK